MTKIQYLIPEDNVRHKDYFCGFFSATPLQLDFLGGKRIEFQMKNKRTLHDDAIVYIICMHVSFHPNGTLQYKLSLQPVNAFHRNVQDGLPLSSKLIKALASIAGFHCLEVLFAATHDSACILYGCIFFTPQKH